MHGVVCSQSCILAQVNSHQANGMMALYNITGVQPAFPLNGTVRTYYIQAVRQQQHRLPNERS